MLNRLPHRNFSRTCYRCASAARRECMIDPPWESTTHLWSPSNPGHVELYYWLSRANSSRDNAVVRNRRRTEKRRSAQHPRKAQQQTNSLLLLTREPEALALADHVQHKDKGESRKGVWRAWWLGEFITILDGRSVSAIDFIVISTLLRE